MTITAEELNKGTALDGSDPSQGGKVPDSSTGEPGAKAPDTPAGEVELDEDGKPLPFDKHPKWKSARAAEKTLQGLMTANEVDTPEELMQLLTSGKAYAGKVNPEDLDTIIEKANTLSKYEQIWEQQAEEKRRAGEEPEETLARVTAENEALKQQMKRQEITEDNQKALKGFDATVTSTVRAALPDLPKDEMAFALEFLGVGNPAVEVDITDKTMVAKMAKTQLKKVEAFKQIIIKQYLEGKMHIPDVPRGGGDTGSPTGEVKNLREARRAFLSTVLGK